jgi:hypothetical protein
MDLNILSSLFPSCFPLPDIPFPMEAGMVSVFARGQKSSRLVSAPRAPCP